MPVIRVQATCRERVGGRAEGDGDVSNDGARVMIGGQSRVNAGRQDAVLKVREEDEEEDDKGEGADLAQRAGLW